MYTPNKSVIDRVRGHQAKFACVSGCWEWPKSRTAAGYGQLSTSNNGKRELHYAHRVSAFLEYGPIESGTHCCHRCDNPACFNPAHIFIGTARDNAIDAKMKGRNKAGKSYPLGSDHWTNREPELKARKICGENHHAARLSSDQVIVIRQSGKKGVDLARIYGVTPQTISDVRTGKTYSSVK